MSTYEQAFQIIFEAVTELVKMANTEDEETERWLDDLCAALFDAYFDREP